MSLYGNFVRAWGLKLNKINYFSMNWLAHKMNNEEFKKDLNKIRGVVYDLGCGKRPYEKEIMSVAERYIGVDWSNTLHGFSADIEADLNLPLPIAGAVADTVVSYQTMEHLTEPQVMLSEAYRILKPSGNIILSVPFQWHVHEDPYDFYRYTRYGLEYMFSKAGFTDISIRESSGFWAMWFLKFNYQTTKMIRGPFYIKSLAQFALVPFWLIDQILAQALDSVWLAPQETTGYIVTARKG
jgi:SAM-dependent methyltransferase